MNRPSFRTPCLGWLVAIALLGFACERSRESGEAKPSVPIPAAVETAGSASAVGAATGAGGALCAEHGVLEAVCTSCNPKLIPIFQAKGDWCNEHAFPESFCPICHPERGGRPAADTGIDDAPPDGLHVTLRSPEVASAIGIETTEAVRAREGATVIATATIVADNARNALVNVRAPGVVRAFKVELGARVSAGTALALIESATMGEGRARLDAARARANLADATYQREKELHEAGISSLRETQEAEQARAEANADLASAEAAVGMIGAETGEAGLYDVRAPIAGVVTQRNFTVGTLVDEEDTLFEIIDTSVLWADIDVPESQARRIATGQRVVIVVSSLPEQEFEGIIRYVAPVVSPETRTIRARAALDNQDGVLRANTYGQARIYADVGAAVVVPRMAVQEAEGVQLVFLPATPGDYITRRVRTLPSDGDMVAVTEGLQEGDRVVTTGAFLLKTETLKESIGAGCCAVDGK